MKWVLFGRKHETPVAQEFDELLDDVIEDFESAVETHVQRLNDLREALRDG